MSFFRRYWGLAALLILITMWWTSEVGPGALYVLSGLVIFWSLFSAPAWCGAENSLNSRQRRCCNNSRGLLLGCHLQRHRWQKLKMAFYSHRWSELSRGTWATPAARFATVTGLVGTVSAIATGVKDFVL